MTKTIVITSGKGGVGKTNISVNTALELAGRHYRTCLFDADLGLANVNILLGIHPEKNLDDFMFRGMSLNEIIVSTGYGVDVIPGSSGVEKMADLDAGQLARLVEEFNSLAGYDYFLIDTSSGISRGVISFCLAASEIILVLTSESTSLADAYAVLKVLSLNRYGGVVRILVNKCVSVGQAKKTYMHFRAVADKHLRLDMVPGGAVLTDPLIEKAVSQQRPITALYPDSTASQCIRAMVSNLIRSEAAQAGEGGNAFWNRYADVVRSDLHLPGEHGPPASTAEQPPRADDQAPGENIAQGEQRLPQAARVSRPAPQGASLAGDSLLAHLPLPSPVSLLAAALTMQGCGGVAMAEMQKIVSCDPALIGRILKTHNLLRPSADGRTLSISEAVFELGEEAVSNLLVTTATNVLLSDWSVQSCLAVNQLWTHGCRCGLMAAALAELTAYPFPEEVYLAAMLHDVGRLAMLSHFPELYSTCASACAHDEEILAAELRVAGTSHAELGAEILSGWGVSSFIADAARYHTETEERIATALDGTRLVYVAHQLCGQAEEEINSAVELARRFFGLSASQVLNRMQIVDQDMATLAREYGIPHAEDIPDHEIDKIFGDVRQQALEFVTLQGMLPQPYRPGQETVGTIRSIQQALGLLFGLNRTVCLLPDAGHSFLQATGHARTQSGEFLENIRFSLASRQSSVVEAYRCGQIRIFMSARNCSIADRQLLNILQADGLLCLPLIAAGITQGLVVCGITASEYSHYTALRKKMEMFAGRAAACLAPSGNR